MKELLNNIDDEYEICWGIFDQYGYGHERHVARETIDFDKDYYEIRIDLVTKDNLREVKNNLKIIKQHKLCFEVLKCSKKTVAGANQYLVRYRHYFNK